jgi:hypothetical protein
LEALASTFFQGTELFFRLPGRSSALSENAEQWERSSLDVVNVAGCIRDVLVCQHPIFVFRFEPKLENLKLKISFVFQRFASVPAAVWRRALQR